MPGGLPGVGCWRFDLTGTLPVADEDPLRAQLYEQQGVSVQLQDDLQLEQASLQNTEPDTKDLEASEGQAINITFSVQDARLSKWCDAERSWIDYKRSCRRNNPLWNIQTQRLRKWSVVWQEKLNVQEGLMWLNVWGKLHQLGLQVLTLVKQQQCPGWDIVFYIAWWKLKNYQLKWTNLWLKDFKFHQKGNFDLQLMTCDPILSCEISQNLFWFLAEASLKFICILGSIWQSNMKTREPNFL